MVAEAGVWESRPMRAEGPDVIVNSRSCVCTRWPASEPQATRVNAGPPWGRRGALLGGQGTGIFVTGSSPAVSPGWGLLDFLSLLEAQRERGLRSQVQGPDAAFASWATLFR